MKKFNVAKNIESQPLVKGLKPNYYYVVTVLFYVGIIAIVLLLLRLMNGSGDGFFIFTLFLFWAIILVFIYMRFKRLSSVNKYKFKNIAKTFSNKDLYKIL